MADFDPQAYVAQNTPAAPAANGTVTVTGASGFDPAAYVAQNNPPAQNTGGFKLGTVGDAAVSGERMLNAIAKPPAALAESLGWSQPAKDLMARDEYLKQHSGTGASLSSLAGDVAGFMIPGAGASKVAEASQLLPKATEFAQKIPGLSKALETGPQWLENILGSKYAQATGLGGTSSLLSPTGKSITDPGFAQEHTGEMAKGAVLGPAVTAVGSGIGRVLSPEMKRFKELLDQGFTKEQIMKDNTLGQIVGGATQDIEKIAGYLPFGGIGSRIAKGEEALSDAAKGIKENIEKVAKDKAAQLDSTLKNAATGLDKAHRDVAVPSIKTDAAAEIADKQARYNKYVEDTTKAMDERHADQFSRPIIQKAIEPAGVLLPGDVKGTDAIKFAQGVEKHLYDEGIKKVGDVRIGDDEVKSLESVLDQYKGRLGESSDAYNKLSNRIQDIKNSVGDSRLISPNQWHDIFKDLGAEAQSYKGPLSSGTDKSYANALSDVKNKWMDIIEGTEGSDIIKKANQVHSALQVPQTAAGYLKTYMDKGGQFDPKDYLRALKSDSSNKRFAAGDSKMQEEALAAYQKMADEKLKLKQQHEDFKNQLVGKKKEINTEMGNKITLSKDNVVAQKAYLKTQNDAEKEAVKAEASNKKDALKSTMEKVAGPENDEYAKHRLAYNLAGLGGGLGVGALLPVDPVTKLSMLGGAYGASHLYGLAQPLLKHVAVTRPEAVRAVGNTLKENAPKIGGLAAYSKIQSDNKKK